MGVVHILGKLVQTRTDAAIFFQFPILPKFENGASDIYDKNTNDPIAIVYRSILTT